MSSKLLSFELLAVILLALVTNSIAGFSQRVYAGEVESGHLHHHHYAELAKAPQKAQLRPNPLEGDPEAAAAGRKLFLEHCAQCHGINAEGGKRAPSLRAEEVQDATSGTLFWIITNGVVRRGMPVWSKLPEPERWQIITFVKSLSRRATPEQGQFVSRSIESNGR